MTRGSHVSSRRPGLRRRILATACAAALSGAAAAGDAKPMRFAADMAEQGNWREAKYRWKLLAGDRAPSASLLNNLAVACEALGETEEARAHYEQLLAAPPVDRHAADNYRRFRLTLTERPGAAAGAGPGELPDVDPAAIDDGKSKRKPVRVSVGIPVPPKLELAGDERLLVTAFRAPESSLLDINRELVRFLRAKFQQQTRLEVLDVNPPPAIPEQTVEGLLDNDEFWKYLSGEFEADLIVSGVIHFDREDESGFQEVDVISSTTGQKVRRTQFVEQEQFTYVLDVFYIDGATGDPLHRDRVRRGVLFSGSGNDPLTAFYELSDAIAEDILSVVVTRRRNEPRYVFRR